MYAQLVKTWENNSWKYNTSKPKRRGQNKACNILRGKRKKTRKNINARKAPAYDSIAEEIITEKKD